MPVIVNLIILHYVSSSLYLKIIWSKRVSFKSFFGAAYFYDFSPWNEEKYGLQIHPLGF